MTAAQKAGELLPCPFCGGAVEMHYTGSSDWEVICKGECPLETRFWISAPKYGYGAGENAEAICRWNRRNPSPPAGRAEGLREAIHRDAERYRELRRCDGPPSMGIKEHPEGTVFIRNGATPEQVDAAVDARIAERAAAAGNDQGPEAAPFDEGQDTLAGASQKSSQSDSHPNAAALADGRLLDSLDWTRLMQGDRRALDPEHQPIFDALNNAQADEPVAWIATYKDREPRHLSKHDGWDVQVVMTNARPVAAKEAAPQGDAVEEAVRAMKHQVIQAAYRPRPMCRDCADNDGVCPTTGEKCDPFEAALDRLRAAAPERVTVPREPVDSAVITELEKAVRKFPTWPTDPIHALAVLGEEYGELNKAVLQMTYEPHKTSLDEVRTEAIQTAAMSLRFLKSLDAYEYKRGEQHTQASAPDAGREGE